MPTVLGFLHRTHNVVMPFARLMAAAMHCSPKLAHHSSEFLQCSY